MEEISSFSDSGSEWRPSLKNCQTKFQYGEEDILMKKKIETVTGRNVKNWLFGLISVNLKKKILNEIENVDFFAPRKANKLF